MEQGGAKEQKGKKREKRSLICVRVLCMCVVYVLCGRVWKVMWYVKLS